MNHGDMDMGGSDCKVEMLWNWNTIDACFLTSKWQIKNGGMMAATCIGVMLMVVVLEFCRRLGKEYDNLIQRQFQRHANATMKAAQMDENCCDGPATTSEGSRVITFRASPLQQLIRAVLHAVTFSIAYIIMLLVMYFNGYIIISIFIGAGIGKFVCDWMVVKVVLGDQFQPSNRGSEGIDEPSVCCG